MNKPNAVVLFVHGSGEHCQRYRHVAHFFNKHQIPCVAYDLRGHGLSDGERGFIPCMDAWLDDLECIIEYIRKNLGLTMPLVIYAHGTGCVNCLAHILQRRETRLDCQAMILSTPSICLKERPKFLAFLASRVVSSVSPRFRLPINGNYSNEYTNDKEIVEAYRNDQLVHDRWPSQTICLLLKLGKLLETVVVQFPVPVMIQHGADDNITPIEMIQKWAQERVKGDDTIFKSWPKHYHEIHNDMGREDVFNHALEWIEKRFKIEQKLKEDYSFALL
jgi:alpha-beta hydrolase superfamily lysophospholipase